MKTDLRLRREKKGLTQVEVASRAKINERQYIRYEQGTRIPRADIALRIAHVLGTTVEKLFGAAIPETTKQTNGNSAME
ncbi:helix-turn-helix domain-containing protein [Ruminococcaceae bacterium OttesenSCG-928-I18]|nr:helix-turn-helix domain-containing protein [Ruminococcaceae bacterium OttesenSCG-928-I18]